MTANEALLEETEVEEAELPRICTWKYCTTCNPPAAQSPAVATLEARINRAWALQDGRTGDALDAAIAEIDARLAALKAVR